MRERNHYVDALKGYAILLVVFGHAVQRTQGFGLWPFADMGPYVLFSGVVTMPLFFAVSGYLAFGRVHSPELRWAAGKARLLLIPWLAWTLLFYFAVNDKFVPGPPLSLLQYAQAQFADPTLWYFIVLFICYVVLAVGVPFGDWTLPLLGVVILFTPVPFLSSLHWYWWWFIGGYFFAKFEEIALKARWIAWVVGVVVYGVGVVVLTQPVTPSPGQFPPLAVNAMAVGAALTGTLVVWLLSMTPLAGPLRHLGIHSMELYAGEFLFVQFLIVPSWVNALITTALAVAGSLALGYLFRLNRWTDLLFLGSKKMPSPEAAEALRDATPG